MIFFSNFKTEYSNNSFLKIHEYDKWKYIIVSFVLKITIKGVCVDNRYQ